MQILVESFLNCTLLPCNHPSTCTRTWPEPSTAAPTPTPTPTQRAGAGIHPGVGVRWRHLFVLCALKSSRVDRVVAPRTRHHSGGTRSRAEIMRRTSTSCPRALCGSLSLSRTQASEYSELARRFDVSCITPLCCGRLRTRGKSRARWSASDRPERTHVSSGLEKAAPMCRQRR